MVRVKLTAAQIARMDEGEQTALNFNVGVEAVLLIQQKLEAEQRGDSQTAEQLEKAAKVFLEAGQHGNELRGTARKR